MNALPKAGAAVVVAYIRTSSAEQGKAQGPEVQRRAIKAYADANGLRIAAEVHEDISGTVPAAERPRMGDALSLAFQHGAGALLLSERSRMARDEFVAFDAERFLAAAGRVALYANGANGDEGSSRLAGGIEHLMAAEDRRRIVSRLKAGREVKEAQHPGHRAQGGRLPLGYRRTRSGLVEIDPAAAEQVREIFDAVRGGLSIRKTAERVGMKPTVVDRIVRRPIYKQTDPGRIVDPRVWNSAQTALQGRKRGK